MATFDIRQHVALSPLTTIGVGGKARYFAQVQSEQELEEAVAFRERRDLPLFVIGGGSNLLIRDEGFPGLVIQLDIKGQVGLEEIRDQVRCTVPAGLPWDDFVLAVCRLGLSGVECLAGIPGYTGGTPVQNVGAYGQDVAQSIHSVRAFDLSSGSFLELAAERCQFGYRTSLFNTHEIGRFLISAVTFDLKKGGKRSLAYAELRDKLHHKAATPLHVYEAVREIRRGKGMLISSDDPDSRSAGSFFKNPVVPQSSFAEIRSRSENSGEIPHWPLALNEDQEPRTKLAAAWLVQSAGFPKGFIDGCAGISSRHALALINRGGATFADIARLRDRIRFQVAAKFGVVLEQEPVELGPDTTGFASAHRA